MHRSAKWPISVRRSHVLLSNPREKKTGSKLRENLHRVLALLAIVAAVSASPAIAALVPNGNPTHNGTQNAALGSATSSTGPVVSLIPNPAVFIPQGSCPWLLPALNVAAQPYNNATNVWNYSFAPLEGNLTLVNYEAWADNSPVVTLGTHSAGGNVEVGDGGAAFVISYSPAGEDPTAGIKWIQVIDSNMPSARGVTYGTALGDGTTAYLDNAASNTSPFAGVDPYYGHLSSFDFANNLGFLDETDFGPLTAVVGLVWEAQVFPSIEVDSTNAGITTHNVTIYDGAWWGFKVVPEPSTWVQLVSAASILLVHGLRRRAKRFE